MRDKMEDVESKNWQDIGKTRRQVTAKNDVRYWQDGFLKPKAFAAPAPLLSRLNSSSGSTGTAGAWPSV
jgi:hypothetical protein